MLIRHPRSYTANEPFSIPTMTSNTAPSGLAFVSSRYGTSFDAWHAMDGTSATHWNSNTSGGVGQYIGYKYTKSFSINRFYCLPYNASYALDDVSFYGSNDTTTGLDGTWSLIETVTGIGATMAGGTYNFNLSARSQKYMAMKMVVVKQYVVLSDVAIKTLNFIGD